MVCAAMLVGLTACATTTSGRTTRTVTVTPSQRPTAAASTSPSPSPAVTPTPTPSAADTGALPQPPPQTKLPGTCESLLPLPDIQDAVSTDVPGRTAFVVGVPQTDIGRLGYLNCRYGLSGDANDPTAVPLIEIGVSLYTTPQQAQRRLTATVGDYESNGATATALTVRGREATLLTGGQGPGYAVPLLVVTSGQRTVAISVADGLGDDALRSKAFPALAGLAIVRTGG